MGGVRVINRSAHREDREIGAERLKLVIRSTALDLKLARERGAGNRGGGGDDDDEDSSAALIDAAHTPGGGGGARQRLALRR